MAMFPAAVNSMPTGSDNCPSSEPLKPQCLICLPAVQTAVPLGAKFTDTVYSDAALSSRVTTNESGISTNTTNISKKVSSDTSSVPGSIKVSNMIKVTQAQYDSSSKDSTTVYVIVG